MHSLKVDVGVGGRRRRVDFEVAQDCVRGVDVRVEWVGTGGGR